MKRDVLYRVIECKGPTNGRTYTVAVYFKGQRLAAAHGHNIQQAEMNAASKALENSKGIVNLDCLTDFYYRILCVKQDDFSACFHAKVLTNLMVKCVFFQNEIYFSYKALLRTG